MRTVIVFLVLLAVTATAVAIAGETTLPMTVGSGTNFGVYQSGSTNWAEYIETDTTGNHPIGTTADSAWSTGNGTVIGLLKAAVANPSQTYPKSFTVVALDASTVTTGGTAVTALSAGHSTAGGFIVNPVGATVNLCINQLATASGTTTAASLICIAPGQQYAIIPSANAVSVISSDSSHPFGGYGQQ